MTQLVKRRVVNPAPSVLALVNPRKKRGKNMATRKRRRSTKRRTVRARAHNPINPTRRKRSTRRKSHSVFAHSRRRRNPINPTHRRRVGRRRHRRNPLGGGGEIIDFAGAGIGLGLAKPFAARFIGGLLPFGQYNDAALTALTGFGLSKLFEMFSVTRRFSKAVKVLGYSTAIIQIVQPIVSRAIGTVTNGAGMSGPRRQGGMRGIGVWPGVPAGVPMIAPAPQQQGMQGIGAWPGVPAGVPR